VKDRLITAALAAGALLLFYALLVPKPQRTTPASGVPVSDSARPAGYLSIWRWLGAAHVPRLSLRERYTALARLAPHPRGNVLLVTLPQRVPMQVDELAYLRRWVARGNTLFVAAALDDTPAWTLGAYDPLELKNLRRLSGLHFEPAARDAPLRAAVRAMAARPEVLQVQRAQPLMRGVDALRPVDSLIERPWTAHATGRQIPLVLATLAPRRAPAVWLERLGAGQIIVSAVASPFSNAGLVRRGNARFLANVLAWSRSPRGAVIFDDAHQGLTAFYDAAAFFADPRLHDTLLWLLALWLVFVFGTQPLRTRRVRWQAIDETAYIEGSARYLAAVVRPEDIARRLIERFVAELRSRVPNRDPWQWLRSGSGAEARDWRRLEQLRGRTEAGQRVNLLQLQSLLARLRRQLT